MSCFMAFFLGYENLIHENWIGISHDITVTLNPVYAIVEIFY